MRIGSIVHYSPFGGGVRVAKVTALDEHNGKPAFEAVLLDTADLMPVHDEVTDEMVKVWGYRNQVFLEMH